MKGRQQASTGEDEPGCLPTAVTPSKPEEDHCQDYENDDKGHADEPASEYFTRRIDGDAPPV
jgi:hypothetical protein